MSKSRSSVGSRGLTPEGGWTVWRRITCRFYQRTGGHTNLSGVSFFLPFFLSVFISIYSRKKYTREADERWVSVTPMLHIAVCHF